MLFSYARIILQAVAFGWIVRAMNEQTILNAAAELARRGGRAGTGKAKSRSEQLRERWADPVFRRGFSRRAKQRRAEREKSLNPA